MDCSLPASLSTGLPRQEYWSGLPCPPQGIFPTQGLNPVSGISCIGRRGFFFFFTISVTWEALTVSLFHSNGKFTLIFLFY